MGARERTERILARQGVNGVLDEIDKLEGDYARRAYVTALFKAKTLDASEMSRALTAAASTMKSDYELTETLRAAAPVAATQEKLARLYVDATTRMRSDYEHRRALTSLLKADRAAPTVPDLVAASTSTMRS